MVDLGDSFPELQQLPLRVRWQLLEQHEENGHDNSTANNGEKNDE